MRAGIFSGTLSGGRADRAMLDQDLVDIVTAAPQMSGADLAREVSVTDPYVVEPLAGPASPAEPVATVVAVDLGIKSMTPRRLAERGIADPRAAGLSDGRGGPRARAGRGVLLQRPRRPGGRRPRIDLLRAVLDEVSRSSASASATSSSAGRSGSAPTS